ncbi:MAG: NAD(P)/FAD-dependent oxidoreductase [Deltaproteobacteria bacterium]|nr:NAD(P)/FAD-dependent oxidoreductase [Deltaproteobacteria bacterium]
MSATHEPAFDLEALRARYRAERDKRLRADGIAQYREVAGDFARYVEDPYVEPGFTRAPLSDEVDALIIGGGFGGLLAGARLREVGVGKIRIVESGGDFGGTWYWNRYPGAQCDIESYIYLPLLEELGTLPSEKYAHGPEILAHAQAIGRHYGLYDEACFQTKVTGLEWNEADRRWIVRSDRGDAIRARFVFMANGPLSRPKLPGIPGVERFEGHSFHTSRWDYAYTGGDTTGGLHRLADKRVGIIGTGATAIQCIPHLGAFAKRLTVFQRTPSSVDARHNRPTDPEFAKQLAPGWQQARMDNFNTLVGGGYQEVDLVGDGWTDVFRILMAAVRGEGAVDLSPEEIARRVELADMTKMEAIRSRIGSIVEDPATAEALKPWYRQFCKRPCFHDEYLPTFNRPNVELVDTQGRGVERITKTGVVAEGREYPVDCLIFATGFEVGTRYQRRAGYDLVGRGGLALSQKWKDRMSTFQGFYSRGFPNCFFMLGLQSGLTPNIPHAINEQAKHLAFVVAHALRHGHTQIEASEAAERDWVALIRSGEGRSTEFFETCTPSYYNNEGKPGEGDGWFGGFHPDGSEALFRLYREWRAAGRFDGLEFA